MKQLQDIAHKQYFISKLIVITVARKICLNQFVLYVASFSLSRCKHQSVNESYSGCFIITGYREKSYTHKDGKAHEVGIIMNF